MDIRPKINNKTFDLKYALEQMDLNIYRIFCPIGAQFTFFSSAHGIFSRKRRMIGYKMCLSKVKTEVIPDIFSDLNSMKIEINKRKARKLIGM